MTRFCSINSVLLLLQIAVSKALACLPPFASLFGVCLHFPAFNKTYCGAQGYCASVGGELITGSNYLQIAGKDFPGRPILYWIGLTDLLEERNAARSGWRWTDGATVPSSSSLSWGPGEPGNVGPKQDCVSECGSRQLCDKHCSPPLVWQPTPMCQQRPQPSAIARQGFFWAADIPAGLTEHEYAEEDGCSRVVTDVESELACAVACRSHSTDQCSAFYFNRAERLCRLVLFTDANIDTKGEPGWTKMTKQP